MTPKAEQLIARQQTYAKFPFLIKVSHEEFGTFLYANSDRDITYEGEVYQAAYFTIDPPDRDGSKISNATISISAVDQFWIEKIRTTQIAANITFMAIIEYNDGGVSGIEQMEEMDFTLRSADWNEDTITWEMVFDENMGIIVPCDTATTLKCPGVA
jgi:hypothetical protein